MDLHARAIGGDKRAWQELVSIAGGRNDLRLPRELVKDLENSGASFEEDIKPEAASDIVYAITHPVNFLRAKVRQIEVSIEHASPPVASNFEDFPNLPVAEAARLMGLGGSGVQLEDWPESVQKEMKMGKIVRPDGRIPEHHDL